MYWDGHTCTRTFAGCLCRVVSRCSCDRRRFVNIYYNNVMCWFCNPFWRQIVNLHDHILRYSFNINILYSRNMTFFNVSQNIKLPLGSATMFVYFSIDLTEWTQNSVSSVHLSVKSCFFKVKMLPFMLFV